MKDGVRVRVRVRVRVGVRVGRYSDGCPRGAFDETHTASLEVSSNEAYEYVESVETANGRASKYVCMHA